MWKCQKCGEAVEDTFDICWSCGTGRDGTLDPAFTPEEPLAEAFEDEFSSAAQLGSMAFRVFMCLMATVAGAVAPSIALRLHPEMRSDGFFEFRGLYMLSEAVITGPLILLFSILASRILHRGTIEWREPSWTRPLDFCRPLDLLHFLGSVSVFMSVGALTAIPFAGWISALAAASGMCRALSCWATWTYLARIRSA